MKRKFFNSNKKGGFSLIELMIVISIFMIITAMALFDQNRLNSNVLLTNLAYDTALTLRSAQSYGIGVKYAGGVAPTGGYGVNFNSATPELITIFRDLDSDGSYDNDDTIENQYEIQNQRGNTVAELCAEDTRDILGSAFPSCSKLPSGKKATVLDVTFKRPDPEAKIRADGLEYGGAAYIVLKSSDGTNCRAVVVEISGQIRVEGSNSSACN